MRLDPDKVPPTMPAATDRESDLGMTIPVESSDTLVPPDEVLEDRARDTDRPWCHARKIRDGEHPDHRADADGPPISISRREPRWLPSTHLQCSLPPNG